MQDLLLAIQTWASPRAVSAGITGGVFLNEAPENTPIPFLVISGLPSGVTRDSEVDLSDVVMTFELVAREPASALRIIDAFTDDLLIQKLKLPEYNVVGVEKDNLPEVRPDGRYFQRAIMTLSYTLQSLRID